MAGRDLSLPDDPYEVLGLEPGAAWPEVRTARRRLAKALHPDLAEGEGRAEAQRRMAMVNRAYDQIDAARVAAEPDADETDVGEPDVGDLEDDGTAFSIDALPVDAFEAVLMAAVELGDVVHMDEPYLLAVLVDHPGPCHCLIELAPAAGSSLVSLDVVPRSFGQCPPPSAVRDAFMAEIDRQAAAGGR